MSSPAKSDSAQQRPQSDRRQTRPRKSFAATPPQHPKQRRQEHTLEKLYPIRNIVDEDQTRYLIDWEDDPRTGRSYQKSWEPKGHATQRAIDDWEATKQVILSASVPESSLEAWSLEDFQDSQPVRTAKRKRLNSGTQQLLQGVLAELLPSPYKRPRKAGTVHTARFSTSQEEELSGLPRQEIPDSFEEEKQPQPESTEATHVVIPYNAEFNREAYIKVPNSNSNTQESYLSLEFVPSLPSTSAYEKGAIIPDSQELPASSPYQQSKPTATQTSIDLGSNATDLERPSLESSYPSVPVCASADGSSSPFSGSPFHAEQIIQSQSHLGLIGSSEKHQEADRDSESRRSQPPSSDSRAESEDIQFQTQVPFLHEYNALERDIVNSLTRESIQPLDGDHAAQIYSRLAQNGDSRVLRISEYQEIYSPDLVEKNKTASNSDEIWQGAQIVPAIGLSESQTASGGSRPKISQGAAAEGFHERNISQAQNLPQSRILSEFLQRTRNSLTAVDHDRSHTSAFDQSPEIILSIELDAAVGIHSQTEVLSPISSSVPQFPDTYEGHYPPRLEPLSDIDMSDEEISYVEKIRRAREAATTRIRAERSMEVEEAQLKTGRTQSPAESSSTPAHHEPSALPSMLPAAPALPIRSQSQDPTVESVEEQPTTSPTKHSPDPQLFSLPLPVLRPADRIVSLPATSSVRDLYWTLVDNSREDIRSLIVNRQLDLDGMQRIDAMIDNLKLVIDHQDLVAAAPTQSSFSDELSAKWAETVSSKCLFLRELLDALRHREKHIAVLARPGRMLDILETILKFNKIVYVRPDTSSHSGEDASGALKVTLLPTGLKGPKYVVGKADAVVAFDETFRTGEDYSNILRTDTTEPRKLCLLISLVVINSAEHIELCLPRTGSQLTRTRSLVRYVWQKRRDVGILKNYPLPDQAAVAIAEYLALDDTQLAIWPLPENPQIGGVRQPSDEQEDQHSGSTTQSRDERQVQLPTLLSSTKRPLNLEASDEVDGDLIKRMRMTPSGDVTSSGDITRVSESTGHFSQAKLEADQKMQEAVDKVEGLEDTQSLIITRLLTKVAKLETELQNKGNHIRSLEARNKDYIRTLRKVQPKYEEVIKERGLFEVERNDINARLFKLQQRIDARIADITKLTEEKATLEAALSEAQATLIASPTSLASDLGKAQDQVRTLEGEKARLEKRLLSMQKDFDFTRDSYQKASSAAAESAGELSGLKEQMIVLERKASENTFRIAQVQRSSEGREREDRIAELEAILKDREQDLQKKNEELKAKTNGRRETRGTSVPRSPRMGSGAMSPRPYARVPAIGSRGNSPAPGDSVTQGFRDTVLFPPSGRRWEHLT